MVESEPAWQQLVTELDDFLPAASSVPNNTKATFVDNLTPREAQVLELIAQGLDNTAIGAKLGISERTARNHVSIVFSKLGVSTRAKAIVLARDAGFGSKPSS
ncbi:MAG TPA: LuxR C-terminal-related transcriptional regulator [Mesorhizobium sp.]|nr:LuxR C-terminal-related transcriptional regulator [Mesorhizobium sp.]